jgi:hypothetical protein
MPLLVCGSLCPNQLDPSKCLETAPLIAHMPPSRAQSRPEPRVLASYPPPRGVLVCY